MAATFSNALILLIYFYRYHIYDDAIHFPTDSDAFSLSNIGYTTLLGKGNRASTFCKPVRQKIRIRNCRKHRRRRCTWNLRERLGIVSWERTM